MSRETQDRIVELWASEGGEKQKSAWLKDKFGMLWQIVRPALGDILNDRDVSKAKRVMEANAPMEKLDIKGFKKAYEHK